MKKITTICLTAAALAAVFIWVAVFWAPISEGFGRLLEPDYIEDLLRRSGPVAPFVFIGLQALQVLVAPIPMQAFGLAGGYIFGAFWGTFYSLVGLTIGSLLAIWLARLFGRRLVERFVHPDTLDKFDHLAERGGLLVFFLIFLLPALPDDAICFIAGLTRLPILALVLMAFLGRLPGLVGLTYLGQSLRDNNGGGMALMIILTAVAVCAALVYIFRARIEALFARRRSQRPTHTPPADDSTQ